MMRNQSAAKAVVIKEVVGEACISFCTHCRFIAL